MEIIDVWYNGDLEMIESMDNEWDNWEEFLDYCKNENKLVYLEVDKNDLFHFNVFFLNGCYKYDDGIVFGVAQDDENCKWFALSCYVGFDEDCVYGFC